MRRLLFVPLLFIAISSHATNPIIGYVQISTGATQSGGFNVQSGTITTNLNLSYVTGTQYLMSTNGNVTGTSVNPAGAFIANQNTLQAGATFYVSSGTVQSFTASTATVTTLSTSSGTVGNLTVSTETVGASTISTATVTTLTASSGTVLNLTSSTGTIRNLTASAATVTTLTASSGTVANLYSSTATIGSLTVSTITANNQTIVISTNVAFSSGTYGIVGVTDGSSAAAGNVGEYVRSYGSGTSAVNGQFVNITSIALSAGDWDVSGNGLLYSNGGTILPLEVLAISLYSGDTRTDHVQGDNTTNWAATGYTTSVTLGGTIPSYRVLVTPAMVAANSGSPVPVYLKGVCAYSGASPTYYGRISARRIR